MTEHSPERELMSAPEAEPRSSGRVERRQRTGRELRERYNAILAVQHTRRVVYAVHCREDGAIKIGCTRDLSRRRSELAGDVLGFMFGGFDAEMAIHEFLEPHRKRGHEYYYPDPPVLMIVNMMRDGFGLEHLSRSGDELLPWYLAKAK